MGTSVVDLVMILIRELLTIPERRRRFGWGANQQFGGYLVMAVNTADLINPLMRGSVIG